MPLKSLWRITATCASSREVSHVLRTHANGLFTQHAQQWREFRSALTHGTKVASPAATTTKIEDGVPCFPTLYWLSILLFIFLFPMVQKPQKTHQK
jgi:hypothetical protein